MKVKSESEVAQSCQTPGDPMDCSLPGSSVHGICQARVLEWGAIAFFDCVSKVITKMKIVFGLHEFFFLSQMLSKEMMSLGILRSLLSLFCACQDC